MGVPGESRALDIAARNGLPAHILEPAASYLSDERTDVAHLIRSLNEKHRKLDDMETERRRRLREAVEKQRKADLASLRLRQKELELKSGGVSELKRLLGESRKTLENLVRELREGGAVVGRTKEVKEFLATLAQSVELQAASLETQRHELDQDLRELEARPQGLEAEISESCVEIDAAAAAGNSGYAAGSGDGQTRETDSTLSGGRKAGKHHAKTAHPAVVKPLAAGDSVWIGAARKPGTLIRPARSGFWLVEMGSLRLTVADSEVARRQDSSRPGEPGAAPAVSYQVELAPREDGGSRRAAFELDLRGMRLAEALEAVERQIDAASLQNLGIFSIIHGTGEGVLGKGIHHYLRTSPAVADYHFASPEEGGFGKTVVRLK
jgi:DNA mismatch repair protein MutS2